MSDVLVHLHQGLLLSSTIIDANKTAAVPDIVKMLSVADDSCTNATVGYITIKPGSVACVIVKIQLAILKFENCQYVDI